MEAEEKYQNCLRMLQNIHREIVVLLGSLNEIEQTVSRLHIELKKDDLKIVDKLDAP